jgi:hypothetical protein
MAAAVGEMISAVLVVVDAAGTAAAEVVVVPIKTLMMMTMMMRTIYHPDAQIRNAPALKVRPFKGAICP